MGDRIMRDYEISLWTLQDSFITVLKPYGSDIKGQIQDGKMNIKNDGNETLSFSIPMYLYVRDGDITIKKENPIWYNTLNGTLIAGLRKVKLIFNKHLEDEAVYEFIILKITERHESDQLFCDLECEGLAFHDLGKKGYKIVLNSKEFYEDYLAWEESDQSTPEPIANLQYWNDKIFTDRTDWVYEIQMDQSAEIGRENLSLDKVYEERYVAGWEVVDGVLQPQSWCIGEEKARTTFDIKENNIFNATQEIAEAFGVFCRYEYEHDENYHITKKKVIYYNNFLNEKDSVIDLTYPYQTNNITREMDSNDLVTKMYIQSVDDDLSDEGTVSIVNVAANKMGTDYLMNFDYLYKIGTISQEQYDEIPKFEAQMKLLQDELQVLNLNTQAWDNMLIKLAATKKTLEDSIVGDEEQIAKVNALIDNLTKNSSDETVTIDPTSGNGQRVPFKAKTKYNPSSKYRTQAISIVPEHSKEIAKKSWVTVYWEYTNDKKYKCGSWDWNRDSKTGEIKEIYNLPSKIKSKKYTNNQWVEIKKFYVKYKYKPLLQYTQVKSTYINKLAKDQSELAKTIQEYNEVKIKNDEAKVAQKDLMNRINKLNLDFEKMMGPALREGYWNPDNYTDYGNKYMASIDLKRTSAYATSNDLGIPYSENYDIEDDGKLVEFKWDNGLDNDGEELSLFNEELKPYYEEGVDQERHYFPCLRLTHEVIEYFNEQWKEHNIPPTYYSVMFYIGTEKERGNILADIDGWVHFGIGSECEFGFRKVGNYVYPVLVLTGAENEDDTTLANCYATSPWIGQFLDGKEEDEDGNGGTNDEINIIFSPDSETKFKYQLGWFCPGEENNLATKICNTPSDETDPDYPYDRAISGRYPVPAYRLYWPRFFIKSLKLKKNQNGNEPDLMVKCGGNSGNDGLTNLKNYEDYYILSGSSILDEEYPYEFEALTIKPQSLILNSLTMVNSVGKLWPYLTLNYTISNADTAIYLDAIQVMKENSQPKVSYTIDLNAVQPELIEHSYNLLGVIAHINDSELKFQNIQGYISEVEIDLDHPWQDSITIQNYKTKFEDLFSKIVAETAAMQKNAYTVGFAAQALTTMGGIKQEALQYSLLNTDLNYAFNNGHLTIDEVNGIMGESEAGIVAYRGGGIFTANEKDENGDWIWNTGILPSGINASIITAGQLNTNLINIYAGNDLRFIWNGEGLFAYKYNTDAADLAKMNGTSIPADYAPKIDEKQYVRYNGDGLHLIAENGATYLDQVWQDDYVIFSFPFKLHNIKFKNNNIYDENNNIIGSYTLNAGRTLSEFTRIKPDGTIELRTNEVIGTYNFTLINSLPYNLGTSGNLYYSDNSLSNRLVGTYNYDNTEQQYLITQINGVNGSYSNIYIPNDIWNIKSFGTPINSFSENDYLYNLNIDYTLEILDTSSSSQVIIEDFGFSIIIKLRPQNFYTLKTYTGLTFNRVEVSWKGFLLRNWNNERVFWADPNSGNLYARFKEVGINIDNPASGATDYKLRERYIFLDRYLVNQKEYPRLTINQGMIDAMYYYKEDGNYYNQSSFSFNAKNKIGTFQGGNFSYSGRYYGPDFNETGHPVKDHRVGISALPHTGDLTLSASGVLEFDLKDGAEVYFASNILWSSVYNQTADEYRQFWDITGYQIIISSEASIFLQTNNYLYITNSADEYVRIVLSASAPAANSTYNILWFKTTTTSGGSVSDFKYIRKTS